MLDVPACYGMPCARCTLARRARHKNFVRTLALFAALTVASSRELGHVQLRVQIKHAPSGNAPSRYFLHELDGGINGAQGYAHQAKMLGRTLLLPHSLTLTAKHTMGSSSQAIKPLAQLLNVSQLLQFVPIELAEDPNVYVRTLVMKHGQTLTEVPPTTAAEELQQESASILMRPHIGHYHGWFSPCLDHNTTYKHWVASAPTLVELIKPIDLMLNLAQEAKQRMQKYCALKVRRGDKIELIPGLDEATKPEAIRSSILPLCPPGSMLYVASNEPRQDFFDSLKDSYFLYTFRDFFDILSREGIGILSKREDGRVQVEDNWWLYQWELELLFAGQPFMDTYCVLYKDGPDQGCNEPGRAGRNAGMYSLRPEMLDNGPRGQIGLLGG